MLQSRIDLHRTTLRYRLSIFWNLIQDPQFSGPATDIEIQSIPILGSHRNEILPLHSLKKWTSVGAPTYFSILILKGENSLKLRIPENAHVQRAIWTGWETIWNGSIPQLNLENDFEISIPLRGWWKITLPSGSIYIFHRGASTPFSLKFKSTMSSLRISLRSQTSRMTVLALFLHIALYALFIAPRSIPNRITQKTELPPSTWTEVHVDSSPFTGRSPFTSVDGALNQKASSKEVSLMVSSLKKLSGQLRKEREQKAETRNFEEDSFQSKQGHTQEKSQKAFRTIHWKPEFNLNVNQKDKVQIHESRQQALIMEFHRYQDLFRGCYESALLNYDEMAVTASYEGQVNRLGRLDRHKFNISGRTTPHAEEILVNCLKTVMSKIKFDETLSGTHIKNQFVFKL